MGDTLGTGYWHAVLVSGLLRDMNAMKPKRLNSGII